jgi:hypothetical protein
MYVDLMDEAKLRLFSIDYALAGHTSLPAWNVREFAFLQLRMLCELIALGCLIAHGDIAQTKSKRLRRTWAADEIISALDQLYPEFYPTPMQPIPGQKNSLEYVTSGYLTKSELKTLNAAAGGIVHRGTIAQLVPAKLDTRVNLDDVTKWTAKMKRLLWVHAISLIDGAQIYICSLSRAKDDDRVQMVRVAIDRYEPLSPDHPEKS